MERMWDEGLRSVSLPLDTRITLRGGNSWSLPKTTGYSRGLMPSAQTTPAGPGYGWSPCPAGGRRTCCQKCSSSRVQLFLHQTGAQAQLRGVLWADRGSRKTLSSILLQKQHRCWSIKHINISGCCQESDDNWWVLWAVILLMVGLQLQARKPLPLLFQPPQWWTDMNTGSVTCLWVTLLLCWYMLMFHTASEECSTPLS